MGRALVAGALEWAGRENHETAGAALIGNMGLMRRRSTILTASFALALVLASLLPLTSGAQSTPVPSPCGAGFACFVFTHASASGSAVDLYVDSKLVAGNVKIAGSSAMIVATPGSHWLQLPDAGSAPSTAKLTASVSFQAGGMYDLVLRDASGSATVSVYPIDTAVPDARLSRSRIINLWSGLGAIAVDLGDPGDKAGGASNASFANIAQDEASDYVESGRFSKLAALSVFSAGAADLEAAPALRPCPANRLCSYILIGPADAGATVRYALAVFSL